MPIKFTQPRFKKTKRRLEDLRRVKFHGVLHRFGKNGVTALSNATPKDTGEASQSWSYEVTEKNDVYRVAWSNSKMAGQVPLVILIQYGHGTRGGTFVPGIDFINPALRPVFEEIKDALMAEVMR